jgi:hypothetical protein
MFANFPRLAGKRSAWRGPTSGRGVLGGPHAHRSSLGGTHFRADVQRKSWKSRRALGRDAQKKNANLAGLVFSLGLVCVRIVVTQPQDVMGESPRTSDTPHHLGLAKFALGHEAAFHSSVSSSPHLSCTSDTSYRPDGGSGPLVPEWPSCSFHYYYAGASRNVG